MAVQDLERIEQKIDRAVAGAVAVSDNIGGLMFKDMSEVMEFAKLMAVSGTAVPPHCRANPGVCLAICIQALEWRSSPFAVANKSYEVNNRLSYESQLVHAIIEQRAPITGRLRHRYEGEGDTRVCIVWGTARGDKEALEYKSPEFGKITPKNSPLWKTKPDLQLYYNASRDWCRVYFPDVLLGIYTEDELRDAAQGPEYAKDITPQPDIGSRLKGGGKGRGFSASGVEKALEHKPAEQVPAPQPEAVKAEIIPPAEHQMTLSAGDVETEIEAKKRAIEKADTQDDIDALLDSGKAFLKEAGRKDLLSDLMDCAKKRGEKIAKR